MQYVILNTRPMVRFLIYLEKIRKAGYIINSRDGHSEGEYWVEWDIELNPDCFDIYETEKLFGYTKEEIYDENHDTYEIELSVTISEHDCIFGVIIHGTYYDMPEDAFYNYLKTLVGETDYYILEEDEDADEYIERG